MKNKQCELCGKEFETDNSRRKYCSQECSRKANIQKSAEWRKNNPERFRKIYRNYYLKNREQIIERCTRNYRKHREELIQNRNKLEACKVKHNNCFSCPTKDGECLYD